MWPAGTLDGPAGTLEGPAGTLEGPAGTLESPVRSGGTEVRALVQRVTSAGVRVGESEIARIGPGLLVLLGVTHDDGVEQADRLAQKVVALRVFEDEDGRMNQPLGEREILCVSQFTLYGETTKGNRPSYAMAAPGTHAKPLYERFCRQTNAKTGEFGAHMLVELANDGPVTLLLEA